MTTASSRQLRQSKAQKTTVGELVAAFYDEARRVEEDSAEAERLARASLLHAMRWGHVKTRRHG